MADSVASSPSRSRSSSTANASVKGRARAASADDVRPARAEVEPQAQAPAARDSAREPSDVAPVPQFDPRQGTLLGFELPVDALAPMTEHLATAQAQPVTVAGDDPSSAVHGKSGSVGKADAVTAGAGKKPLARENAPAGEKPAATEKAAASGNAPAAEKDAATDKEVAPQQAVVSAKRASLGKASTPEQAAGPELAPMKKAASGDSMNDASLPAGESKLLSPGAALASAREQAARRPAPPARPSGPAATEQAARSAQRAQPTYAFPTPSAVLATSVAGSLDDTAHDSNTVPPAALAATVASLQAALADERRAAEERWRRTRRWLALASAGLVVLFAVSVGQTVALVSFSHRAQAAQQQTQSALNDQQAALASLASSTSALAARVALSPQPDSNPDTPSGTNAINAMNAGQRPAKHAHLRHSREKAKPAAH